MTRFGFMHLLQQQATFSGSHVIILFLKAFQIGYFDFNAKPNGNALIITFQLMRERPMLCMLTTYIGQF